MSEQLTKTMTFARLPAIVDNAEAWRLHTDRHWRADGEWVYPRQPAEPPFVAADDVGELLQTYMPQLMPEFRALLGTAEQTEQAAQELAMYNMRPLWDGCSQTIGRRADRTTLLRNYDLGVDDCACCFRHETFEDRGWIIGSGHAGWGYLDGLNDRGLAISVTFGGRFVVGPGFLVPIVVRWLLLTCATVEEALERLVDSRVPHRFAKNLLLVDKEGAHAVAYLSPDRPVVVDRDLIGCTNHQGQVDDVDYARRTQTVERLEHITAHGGHLTVADFLQPPLYKPLNERRSGTLYTVEYDPVGGTAHVVWPKKQMLFGPDSEEATWNVTYSSVPYGSVPQQSVLPG